MSGNQQQQQLSLDQENIRPRRIASAVGLWVWSFIQILGWGILAVTTIAGAFIVLAAIWWAIQQIREATGI
ncbi:MAG: hypothetical protein AABZ47_16110 [Planctomycetota bacterium]